MKEIVNCLQGGLGNQMFQYAVGRALSLRCGVPLLLEVSSFLRDPKRCYMLSPFEPVAWPVMLSPGRRWWAHLTGRYWRERGFAFDPQVFALGSGTILDGYFQSEKYFVAYTDTICRDFSLKEPLSQNAQKYLQCIEGTAVSVAVHVRRGDYVSDPVTQAFHGNCSWEYYEHAMQFLRERVEGEVQFFFFSDEPAWVRSRQVDGIIVEGLSPHEDMFLITHCKHQIIANSSFSWWGAWLNVNPDKIVIAPKRWFANEEKERQTGDLIPEGWVRL